MLPVGHVGRQGGVGWVAPPVLAQPFEQGPADNDVQGGQPAGVALRLGARQPGPALVGAEGSARAVAEQAAPVPRAGVVGVGRGGRHVGAKASGAGGDGLCIGQSSPFLGWTKGRGGLAPGRAKPWQDRACKKRPDGRLSEPRRTEMILRLSRYDLARPQGGPWHF